MVKRGTYKHIFLLACAVSIVIITLYSFSSMFFVVKNIASSCYTSAESLPTLRPLYQVPMETDSEQVFQMPLTTPYKCMKKVNLLILVTSSPARFQARAAIRDTWGTQRVVERNSKSWRTLFLLGQDKDNLTNIQIKEESELHKDLLIGLFTERFYNLPIKLMMAFEWASKMCEFAFLLKADDDVFVNVPNVFRFLDHDETPKTKLYSGWVHFEAHALRFGKYKVEKSEYPYKRYPRFVAGGGMLFSSDVIDALVPHFNMNHYFKLDDVYIGLLCLKIGVDATHHEEFRVWQRGPSCLFRRREIIHHRIDDSECMKKMYRTMQCSSKWTREGKSLKFHSVDSPGRNDLL